MALSGSATKTIGSHWFLDIEWSATQSIANNTSTITANLYWRCDSYGAVSSSASKTCSITIGAVTDSFTASGLASLSGGQKKKIHTYTRTITHNGDGTASVAISGMFDMDVNLGGTTYSNQTVSDGTQTLNTIPRESTLTSSASWTFPSNISYTIDENSTSFTHKIEVYVNGVLKKTVSNITGTTGTISFTTAENQNILTELNKDTVSWNQATILRLYTYNSATQNDTTKIGEYDRTGTCSSPSATTVSVTPTTFDIGATLTYSLNGEANTGFYYDLTASIGGYTKTLMSKVDPSTLTGLTWATLSDKTGLLGGLPTASSGSLVFSLSTYYNNAGTYTKVRATNTFTTTANISTTDKTIAWSDNPTVCVTWADTNSTTTSVTGNSAWVVQGKSTLEFTLGTLATAPVGTTLKQYEITLLGVTRTLPPNSTVGTKFPVFTATELNTSSNIVATVKIVDNRNNVTQFTKTISVTPYAKPVITSSPARQNGFDNNTTIAFNTASISLMNVAGADKNSVAQVTTPSTAPSLSLSANAGSTVQVATHYVAYTWVTPHGETLPSPQQSIAVTSGQNLVVTIPARPTGVTQANIYISTTTGIGYLQGNTTTTTYTRTTAVTLSGTQKPTIHSANGLRYRYKETVASWTGVPYRSFTWTVSGANLTVNSVVENLDNTKSYDVELTLTDKLGDSTTIIKTVPVGLPVMFMDSAKKSIGINMFPSGANALEINGGMLIKKNFGGLTIQSDIVGQDPEIHMTSPGGSWSIRNDDSASNIFDFRWNNVSKANLDISGNFSTVGVVEGRLSHASGYLIVKSYSSSYGTGSGRLWYNFTDNEWNIVSEANAPSTINARGMNVMGGDIQLNGRTILMTDGAGTSFDQIWFNDTTNEYYFMADATASKSTTSAGAGTLRALAFTPLSDRELKTNIQTFDDDMELSSRAIDYVVNTPVYTYRYKHDIETESRGRRIVPKRVGIMAQESPDAIQGIDGKSIDLYAMNSFMWKALQEVAGELNRLEKKLKQR